MLIAVLMDLVSSQISKRIVCHICSSGVIDGSMHTHRCKFTQMMWNCGCDLPSFG